MTTPSSRPDPAAPRPAEQAPAAGPRITYPGDLPVSQRREDIQKAISENQVVVIAGATGSGKTTRSEEHTSELQ